MKTLSACHRLLIAASLLSLGGPAGMAADSPVIAADPRIGQVLGLPSSRCDHMIDLLLLNQYRQNTGTGSSLPDEWPLLSGDLELQCVELVSEGGPGQGPLFRLTLQNHSQIPVGDFRITLVAVLGTIHPVLAQRDGASELHGSRGRLSPADAAAGVSDHHGRRESAAMPVRDAGGGDRQFR